MVDVVVTGLGVVSSAGRGVEALRTALQAGRDGLAAPRRLESPRLGRVPVGEVPDELLDDPSPARNVRLGAVALLEALDQAGLDAVADAGTGLVLGCAGGGMPETEEQIGPLLSGGPVDANVWPRHGCDAVAAQLADRAGAEGPVLSVSTACASGAQALARGADLLADGSCERVVAGGVEALSQLALHGYASLGVVSSEGCRPFDAQRAGLSPGEGAAFVVLETASAARERGARILARLAGAGNAAAGRQPGQGAEAALRAALAEARLDPADVDWICAHGTGTPAGDALESAAVRRVFGADVPALSSLKRCTGHTFAAAGALGAVASILALAEGWLPGTPGLSEPDPQCGLEPLRETVDRRARAVLTQAFGFGGHNAALCFTAVDAGAAS